MAENLDGRTLSLSDRDPNPGPLMPKLMAGRNVSIKNYGQAIKIDVDVPLTEGTRQAIENIGKVCVQQEDTPEYLRSKILQGDRITINDNGHTLTLNADVQDGDHKVLASSGDTTADYLDQKLSGSGVVAVTDNTTSLSVGITPSSTDGQVLTTDNGAVAWKTPATQTGDHKVAVNSSDSSPDYLFDKIEAGTNISTSVSSGKVKIDAATQTGDHKVSVDGTDVANYLENKIEAGTNVSITKSSGKLVISSTDTGMLNPMTDVGDLIIGGTSGAPTRLAKGYQGQVLKVGASSLEWAADTGFANPMEEQGDLIVGSYDGVASRLPIGTVNQFLFSNGTTAEWATLPLNIDWVVPPALTNGDFNQVIDRTFYVRVYPSLQMRAINHVAILLSGAVAADVIRVAVYDNTRTMMAYGESTGSSSTFRRVSLTQLQPWVPGTNDLYYLGVSIHSSSNSSTKFKTASVTSPSYCWYEDVALTSGRAMPAPSSLTASSSKVPIIGLRGR